MRLGSSVSTARAAEVDAYLIDIGGLLIMN